MTRNSLKIPSYQKSFWRAYKNIPNFPALTENLATDVAIIGAGITGVTTAYLLAKEGVKVTLIDAGKIIDGTTGYTTAKISSQHGLIYDELIRTVGKEKARHYYDANQEALSFIQQTSKTHNIECDFETQHAYLYATTQDGANQLDKEAKAYEKLGMDGGIATSGVSLPFEVKNALMMPNQAQFHPVKYLSELVRAIVNLGSRIFESTRAVDIEKKEEPIIHTCSGRKISCKQVIVSSHFPFNDFDGMYFSRLHTERSYALAVRTEAPIPDGMYLSVDGSTRSLRHTITTNGEKLLLIGGEGHPTGQNKKQTFENYEKLREFGDQFFQIKDIPYRWSSQDNFTLDKVPYIGPARSGLDNILVATGYAKWGMTNGTAAALLLKDHILRQANAYKDLFDPSRSQISLSGIKSFVKENTTVAKELIKGKVKRKEMKIEDLELDEGALVKLEGKKVGAYKDPHGQCYLVNPTCTHMGCDVEWNNAERSWDCPCHASRFSYKGEVIEGPAVKALKTVPCKK